jgi:PKD repeat protein
MMSFTKGLLSVVSIASILFMLQGCGGDSSSQSCCQTPKLEEKVSEVEKVVPVPEVKGNEVIYVDRNVTVIQYVDRNVTVIQYVDRNVTVEKILVRPEAEIAGLKDGSIITEDTLEIKGVESSDEDGNVTKYQWTLDDNNISTEKNPTIDLPTEPGTHKICLTVTDNDNLKSKMTCKTFVIPAPNVNPTASITGLNEKKVKTKCAVTVSGMDSIANNNAEIKSYSWVIDKNITLEGADQNLSFKTLGEHEVCLTVVDTNDLNDTICNTVNVQDHDAPTPVLTVYDQNKVITGGPDGYTLTKGNKYDFSCKGSHDDCNSSVPVTCKWNAHSYRIENNEKVDYVSDCIEHNGSPKEGEKSWVKLCGSGNYEYMEIILEVTDQFGKTSTKTEFFKVAP